MNRIRAVNYTSWATVIIITVLYLILKIFLPISWWFVFSVFITWSLVFLSLFTSYLVIVIIGYLKSKWKRK